MRKGDSVTRYLVLIPWTARSPSMRHATETCITRTGFVRWLLSVVLVYSLLEPMVFLFALASAGSHIARSVT